MRPYRLRTVENNSWQRAFNFPSIQRLITFSVFNKGKVIEEEIKKRAGECKRIKRGGQQCVIQLHELFMLLLLLYVISANIPLNIPLKRERQTEPDGDYRLRLINPTLSN